MHQSLSYRLLQRIATTYRWLKRIIVEYILRLRIRIKLSIIIAITVIGVALVLSSVIMTEQRDEIRAHVEALARLTTEHLANSSRDNLLLGEDVPIQETVNGIHRMKIDGVKAIMIVNRNGIIVAHSNLAMASTKLPPAEASGIDSVSELTFRETADELQYIRPIYVHHVTKDGTREVRIGTAVVSYSKEALFRPLEVVGRTIIVTALIVCTIAIAIVFFLSGKILQIILQLSDGARRVGEGDYHVRIFTRIKDEIGVLTREFNKMVEQLRERALMQKYVSTHTLEMIQRQQTLTLGGERKTIAILFSDIRNFTHLVESMPPERVVTVINTYLDAQMEIITGHNGSVDKFLGDGLMAIFTGPNMAEDAVRSAVAIQKCLRDTNIERRAKGETAVEVGIGIATGPAVLGNIGSRTRMDYTAIGDSVNIASRLCNLAEPNCILITEAVKQGVDGMFAAVAEGSVNLKGKHAALAVYSVKAKAAK